GELRRDEEDERGDDAPLVLPDVGREQAQDAPFVAFQSLRGKRGRIGPMRMGGHLEGAHCSRARGASTAWRGPRRRFGFSQLLLSRAKMSKSSPPRQNGSSTRGSAIHSHGQGISTPHQRCSAGIVKNTTSEPTTPG